MVKISKKQIIFCAFTALIFSDCANQLPPGGGEVDKIPPRIVNVYPENGTTNFSDDHFTLDFSEYVVKRTVKDAIFISPAIDGDLETDWTGTSVDVYFPNKLRDSTTYIVTIGSDVVDYNNKNHMAESFSFTFSTGNEIDKRVIKGKVFSDKPSGVLIYAYKTVEHDTIDPSKIKPDFISQTGKDGSFSLLGLSAGIYRVFAVLDQYRDLLFQSSQDEIGMPYTDVSLSEKDTLFSGLNFFLTQADTVKPRLISAVMTDRNHILVKVSKDIDSTCIKSTNFFVYDSTDNKKFNPIYAFKGNTKQDEIAIVLKDSLNDRGDNYLFVDELSDRLGNTQFNDNAHITVSTRMDTSKPGIFRTSPLNNTDNADFQHQQFTFYFNDAFDSLLAKKGITFSDTLGNKIPYSINFIDDASFQIIPAVKLKTMKKYRIEIKLNYFKDAAGNFFDSTYIYKFTTLNGLDFTGLSGDIKNVNLKKNPKLILQSTSNINQVYKTDVLANSKFQFKRIDAGKYLLWYYYDTDSSNTYTYGWPYPFKKAEEFDFYPDTLNLRPRWTITDLSFQFNK